MPLPLPPFSPRSAGRSLVAAAVLAALLLPAGPASTARAQDLVGCQLVEGTLQCVPGITADPQQQIRILDRQIGADQTLEGAVEQRISGLGQLLLQGEARVQVSLQADALADLPPSAYHWYRRPAAGTAWVLIPAASGPSYRLVAADVGQQVMVVVALPSGTGSQRSVSVPLGPVSAP
ncbi:MAG: hypothetical protein ACKOBY_08960 [Cyanobium sp.]